MSCMKLLWLRLLVLLLGETIDLKTTLLLALRKSLPHVRLERGFYEGAKVIEIHTAQLCVLAEDCNQPTRIKFVCADHNVNLILVLSAKTLGEWVAPIFKFNFPKFHSQIIFQNSNFQI
ncbi:hypothetical protein PVL29_017136 [Vitis rotundifolia]|uniref:Ribosomal protein eL8/eL30/eS12/Gadd45 domain-containing protein n=1 Tax=Vitis rotundifolia TaxID=103349 RepID=A0AA39DIM2_VITRO|nr:hypothetical protein PVL29_017136 [Vitis rotundifolia]